jgi:dynein heavy chain 1
MLCLQLGVWLVMFCDEINLPDMDAYGTQRVISFLRQMVEHNGFYRSAEWQCLISVPTVLQIHDILE